MFQYSGKMTCTSRVTKGSKTNVSAISKYKQQEKAEKYYDNKTLSNYVIIE